MVVYRLAYTDTDWYLTICKDSIGNIVDGIINDISLVWMGEIMISFS